MSGNPCIARLSHTNSAAETAESSSAMDICAVVACEEL
jgi:hypothetical protein